MASTSVRASFQTSEVSAATWGEISSFKRDNFPIFYKEQ
jgi:hypothetical protein